MYLFIMYFYVFIININNTGDIGLIKSSFKRFNSIALKQTLKCKHFENQVQGHKQTKIIILRIQTKSRNTFLCERILYYPLELLEFFYFE